MTTTKTYSQHSIQSPFGMVMPGRNWQAGTASGYRFGFQNQEIDNQIKGVENSLNYTFRMYDCRIGRFFNLDPLTAKYPYYSPYQFSGNKVIAFREMEGLEEGKAGNAGTYLALRNSGYSHESAQKVINDMKVAEAKAASHFTVLFGGLAIIATGGIILEVGAITTTTFFLEEGAEFVFEEITGIPIILDPLDALEQMAKKGVKQFAQEIIIEGRKFAAGTDIKTLQSWSYNVKTFGKELAEKYSNGEITRLQMKEAAFSGPNIMPNGSQANHIFSGKLNKLPDTKENREMLTQLANDNSKYVGIDEFGKKYFAKTNANGTQTYVYTQGGIIKGGGENPKSEDLVKRLNLKKI